MHKSSLFFESAPKEIDKEIIKYLPVKDLCNLRFLSKKSNIFSLMSLEQLDKLKVSIFHKLISRFLLPYHCQEINSFSDILCSENIDNFDKNFEALKNHLTSLVKNDRHLNGLDADLLEKIHNDLQLSLEKLKKSFQEIAKIENCDSQASVAEIFGHIPKTVRK